MDDRNLRPFGRYEVLKELGRGAMGVVYQARDPKINRLVAVKTISLAGHSPDEQLEYRARFLREAEAAGRLSHPGIVTIFDVGEEAETRTPYIVMEYVGGESLDKVLSRGDHKLPVQKALQLAVELAAALDCAHGQGVVHRDLKPANILLTEDGHAKIADFGVAKLNLSNQTLAGRALGTPAYMSPEQLNGEPVDGRSDIFSLGVILYTVLTGYRPFQGNSALTVSFKVVNREPIPATLLDTGLPEGLDSIITRAMAKEPANRYQNGAELVSDIQQLDLKQNVESNIKLPSIQDRNAHHLTLSKPEIAKDILAEAQVVLVMRSALRMLRKKPVVAGLVLAAFFILVISVMSFGNKGTRPEVAESPLAPPLNMSTKTTESAMSTTLPTTPAAPPMASTSKASARAAKQEAKPKAPAQTHSSSTRVARLNPPVVSPPVAAAATPPPLPAVSPATLEIEIDHKFAEAHLSIWVDAKLSYTHLLEGTDKKHLVVFHRMQGHELHSMQIPPGKHDLRVQVTSDLASYDQSSAVSWIFVAGHENTLHIGFDKHGEINLSLQ
jgi:serine/threonine protein kinase